MAQRPREENNCARDRRGTRQYGEDFISLGQEEVPPRDAMALYVSLDRRNLDGRCLRTQTPEGSKPKSGPRERSESECPPLHRQTATNTRYCLCPSLSRWPPSRDSLLFPLAGTCDAAYRPPTPSHPCLSPRRAIPNARPGRCGLRPAPPPPSCVWPPPTAEPPPATRSHGNEFLTACPLILPIARPPAHMARPHARRITTAGAPPALLCAVPRACLCTFDFPFRAVSKNRAGDLSSPPPCRLASSVFGLTPPDLNLQTTFVRCAEPCIPTVHGGPPAR